MTAITQVTVQMNGNNVPQQYLPQQNVIYTQGGQSLQHSYFNLPPYGNATIGLGAVQIFIGCLVIILEIVLSVISSSSYFYPATGYYAGAIFIIAGALAIAGVKHKSKRLIIAAMALSIIAAIMAGIVCNTLWPVEIIFFYYQYHGWYSTVIVKAIAGTCLFFSNIEMLISISQAGVACAIFCRCCGDSSYPPAQVVTGQQVIQPGNSYIIQQSGYQPNPQLQQGAINMPYPAYPVQPIMMYNTAPGFIPQNPQWIPTAPNNYAASESINDVAPPNYEVASTDKRYP